MSKHIKTVLLSLVLLLSLSFCSFATKTGSITVVLPDEYDVPVIIHRIADSQGKLCEDFTLSGITTEDLNAENTHNIAENLYDYAVENSVTGNKKIIDESFKAIFDNLEEGCWLVYCESEKFIFDPFIVSIPLDINGEALYDIEAYPKTEEEETATTPDDEDETSNSSDEDIPQTGESIYPKIILFGAGVILTVAGIIQVVKGHKKADEKQ